MKYLFVFLCWFLQHEGRPQSGEISTETKARFSLNAVGAEREKNIREEKKKVEGIHETRHTNYRHYLFVVESLASICILLPISLFVVPPYDYINRCFLFQRTRPEILGSSLIHVWANQECKWRNCHIKGRVQQLFKKSKQKNLPSLSFTPITVHSFFSA